MNAAPLFSPVLLIVASLLVLAGAAIFLLGYRPRPAGDTPHCRSCAYTLIGNQSGRCPECGASLSEPGAVVRGKRRRRPGAMAMGAILTVLGLSLAYLSLARGFDWYALKPTTWLLADLEARPALRQRAWDALERRFSSGGGLSSAHHSRLIDEALKEQGKFAGGPLAQSMIDFLGSCAARGTLSESQKNLFIDQIAQMRLSVRPTVRAGDSASYSLQFKGNAPSNGWWCRIEQLDVSLDGKVVHAGGGSSGFSGTGASGSSSASFLLKEIGTHTISARQRLRLYPRQPGPDPAQGVFAERLMEFSAQVQVVPPEDAPAMKRILDPGLMEQVRASITPKVFMLGKRDPAALSGEIEIKAPPVALAFDVIARFEGRQHVITTLACAPGKSSTYHLSHSDKALSEMPASITLVLRPSERVARNTIDFTEYFDAEIVFDEVPVARGPNAGPR